MFLSIVAFGKFYHDFYPNLHRGWKRIRLGGKRRFQDFSIPYEKHCFLQSAVLIPLFLPLALVPGSCFCMLLLLCGESEAKLISTDKKLGAYYVGSVLFLGSNNKYDK